MKLNNKGQVAQSLTGLVVGGILTVVISAIIIYAVGYPILMSLNNTSAGGVVPDSQQTNFNTVLLLLGILVVVVILAVFMLITRTIS